ncbi:hypothetical protein ACH4UM_18165 [Streptomyces sp. NPDC020801]|uniref:hypothetical protein n=1 Tax=unclassified Streptomyces TaxID=2593676 RepID=UPI003791D930
MTLSERRCWSRDRPRERGWRTHDWRYLRFRRKGAWQRRTHVSELRQFRHEMEGRAWDKPAAETRAAAAVTAAGGDGPRPHSA